MAYSQNFGFGSGVLFGTPSSPALATPIRFGVLQDVSIDFSFSTKQLFGSYQFPVAIGRGTAKVTGKAKFARIDSNALSTLFFNLTPGANNQIIIQDAEAAAVPGSGPYTCTVNHSAAFEADRGVNYATTGQPLVLVASSPATGQYSYSAGVYTFAAGDASAAMLISYSWTDTKGSSTLITNPVLGTATPFQIDFYQRDPNSTQQWGLRLYACLSSKLNLATKLEDFVIPEFDFEAYANASNQIGTLNLPN